MTEFILVIPLLALVIAATFFFGMVMRNQQRLRVADRYIAWDGLRDEPHVNEQLLGNRGRDIGFDVGSGPWQTREDLVDAAADEGSDAGELAERTLLGGEVGQFPHGWWRRVRADFPQEVAALRRIQSGMDAAESTDADGIGRRHVREGAPWQRGRASLGQSILDLYMDDFDDVVHEMAGNSIGQAMRSIYLRGW